MSSIGTQAIAGLRWLAAGRLAGQLFTWAVTILVIRILSPQDYGLMAMAMVIIGFLVLFDELGLGAALIQREELEPEIVQKVFGFLLLLNFVFLATLFLVAPLLAAVFEEPRLTSIVRVLSLQFPVSALTAIPDAMLRRRMQFRGKAIAGFVAMVIASLVTLLLALAGFGVWSLVAGNLLGSVARMIGFQIAARYPCAPRFRFSGLREIASFGGLVSLDRVLWFVYSQADVMLIGKVLGKELLGFYSVAMHLAALPMTKIAGMIDEVSFSGFSRIKHDLDQVRQHFCKASGMLSFFAFPVFFGMSSVAPEIVQVFLGDKWALATVPLQVLCLVIPLRMLAVPIAPSLMGLGRAGMSVVNGVIAVVLMPAAFLIGLQWGLNGVCYAWLISYPLYFVIALGRTLPVLGTCWTEYLAAVRGPALASLVMYLAVFLVRGGLRDLALPAPAVLVLQVLAGTITFAALMWFTQRPACHQMLRLIRR